MALLHRLSERFELMNSMATACGHDISEALLNGQLGADQLRQGAFRCCGCSSARACKTLLATTPNLGSAPDYCANKLLFDRLPQSAI